MEEQNKDLKDDMDEMFRHFSEEADKKVQEEVKAPSAMIGNVLDTIPEGEKTADVIQEEEKIIVNQAAGAETAVNTAVDDLDLQKKHADMDMDDVSKMIASETEDEPAAYTEEQKTSSGDGFEFEVDELDMDNFKKDTKGKTDRPRKNRNQPTAEDLRKDTIRFWIFTAIVALLVSAAVLFVLYSRGIIGHDQKETEPIKSETETTKETESETETTKESETESETETTKETESETEKEESSKEANDPLSHYENLFIVSGTPTLNVRKEATTDSKIIATIDEFGGGNILEQNGDWYHIKSGGFEGYVVTTYVKTGDEAKTLAKDHLKKRVLVTADTLNVREAPNTSSEIVWNITKGYNLEYLGTEDGFYHVQYPSLFTGYVSADFTDFSDYLVEAIAHYE